MAGRKQITIAKDSNVPRPSNRPMEDTIGFDEVYDRINPTKDKIKADTVIEYIFSSIDL